MDRPSIADLAARLAANVDGVVPALLPGARRTGGFWHAGDVTGAAGGSLYVHRTGPRAGKWTDSATDQFGDLLDLAQAALGLDLRGACDWARSHLGIETSATSYAPSSAPSAEIEERRKRREEEEKQRRTRNIAKAIGLIGECMPSFGTDAELHLLSRGLHPRRGLGFHPACPHPDGFRMPAMVAPVRHIDHGIVAAHCTFLKDGKKAPIDRPRIIYGPCGGGAVHFGEPEHGKCLAIAEGIENALTVAQTSNMPAWAALSAGGIEALILPPVVDRIVICADNDAHGRGERAALTAAGRWIGEGRQVRIAMPAETGKDFNDILCCGVAAKIKDIGNVAA